MQCGRRFCRDNPEDGKIDHVREMFGGSDEKTKSALSGYGSENSCKCIPYSMSENVSGTGMGDMGLFKERF